MWLTDIRRIYFFGDVNDEEGVNLVNDLTAEYGDSEDEESFEIINLTA